MRACNSKGMGPCAPLFRLWAALVNISVLIVMRVAGTMTPNAKSRTNLFNPAFQYDHHPRSSYLSFSVCPCLWWKKRLIGSQDTSHLVYIWQDHKNTPITHCRKKHLTYQLNLFWACKTSKTLCSSPWFLNFIEMSVGKLVILMIVRRW